MKWINLSELFRQPDWPETLTQEQNARLMQQKLDRARLYQVLHSDLVESQEDFSCLIPQSQPLIETLNK